MLAKNLTRNELIEENKKLIDKIEADIGKIERVFGNETPSFLRENFKELLNKNNKPLEDLSTEKLRTFNRDLNYMKNLKSLSIEGVNNYNAVIEPMKNFYDTLSAEDKKKFNKIISSAYEYTNLLFDFKYTVIEYVTEQMNDGVDSSDILKELIENFTFAYDEMTPLGGTKEDLGKTFKTFLRF